VKKVNGAAAALCGKFARLRRKYPFNPRSDDEVSLEEFANFFKPGGTLWTFSQQPPPSNLLLKVGGQWMQNPAVSQPQLTPEFLASFRRLAAISDMLFAADQNQGRLQYTLTPSSSSNILSLVLEVDGTRIVYKPGQPATPVQLAWPGPPALRGARLSITSGMTAPLANYPGLWGIFRMMENNDRHAAGSGIFEFSNIRQGRSTPLPAQDAGGQPIAVRVQVDFPAGSGPLEPGFFSAVGCSSRAAQ
jgi:type VI secretion system protein ImpL